MKRTLSQALVPLVALLILGCTQEESDRIDTFHFQGQDCLHCHNVDLEESSHLNFGGTVYNTIGYTLDSNITQEYCTKPLFIQIFELNGSIVLDTNKSNSLTDPGFNGKGNVFSLQRKETIPNGSYLIKIVDANGSDIIPKSSNLHDFNGTYDPDIPNDSENRYSCNACHSIVGSSDPLKARIIDTCMETK